MAHAFSTYVSATGSSWTLTETIAMTPTISVGLPVTSHTHGTLTSATIDGVTVAGS